MKPLNGYIQIEFKEAEEVTSSGIYLANRPEEKTEEGKVINGGESDLVKGTMVLFKNYCLEEFDLGEDKYWFVKAEHIIAAYDPS